MPSFVYIGEGDLRDRASLILARTPRHVRRVGFGGSREYPQDMAF
jgi:hypothetical protein